MLFTKMHTVSAKECPLSLGVWHNKEEHAANTLPFLYFSPTNEKTPHLENDIVVPFISLVLLTVVASILCGERNPFLAPNQR